MDSILHDPVTITTAVTIAIAAAYMIFRKQINSAAFAAGKAVGIFLKRFKLDDEAEEMAESFVDGMKSNDKAERIEEIKKDLLKNDLILSIPIPGEKENSK